MSKVWENARNEVLSVDKIEDHYFGTSIMRMFAEFKNQFLGRKIPGDLLARITEAGSTEQIERTLECLQDLIAETKKPIPDRGAYSGPTSLVSYNSIWTFKESVIDPAYIRLAPVCTEALVHEWAIE